MKSKHFTLICILSLSFCTFAQTNKAYFQQTASKLARIQDANKETYAYSQHIVQEWIGGSYSYTIYRDVMGNYLQYELDDNVNLVKLNKKPFSEKDYAKLHKLLLDTRSDFKYCHYNNQSPQAIEKQYYELDAISGATRPAVNIEYVDNSIKMSYCFWQSVHNDADDNIKKKSQRNLNSNKVLDKTKLSNNLENQFQLEKDKTQLLFEMLENNLQLNHASSDYLASQLDKLQNVDFNLVLLLLEQQSKLSAKALAYIGQQLNSTNYYKQLVSYNFCIRKKNTKAIKGKNIAFKNIKL